MKYRAKIALNTRKGIIQPGKLVPSDYPRMDLALSKGWIEAEKPPPLPRSTREDSDPSDMPAAPVNRTLVIPEDRSDSAISESMQYGIEAATKIDQCEFLSESDQETLRAAGIKTAGDLIKWTEDALIELPRIGKVRALKILEWRDTVFGFGKSNDSENLQGDKELL